MSQVQVALTPEELERLKKLSDELKENHRWLRGIEQQMYAALTPMLVQRNKYLEEHNRLTRSVVQLREGVRIRNDDVYERAFRRKDDIALNALDDFWEPWDALELARILPGDEDAQLVLEPADIPDDLPRELDRLPTRCLLPEV